MEPADHKRWESEKQRYRLQQVDPGVVVYIVREEAATQDEPVHYLCPACYEKCKKSILQATPELRKRRRVHQCPECRAEFVFGYEAPPSRPDTAPDIDPWTGRPLSR